MLKRLLIHISRYSLGSLFTALAGVVSFPFLTRVFSVPDYGLMNLVSATLTGLVAVAKLGQQHSVVRFGSSLRAEDGAAGKKLVSTAVFGMAGTSAIVALTWLALISIIPLAWIGGERVRFLFALVSVLVVLQPVESSFLNLLRAQQQSALFTAYQVVSKYAGLGLMIVALLLIHRELSVFYSAQIVSTTAGVTLLGVVLFRSRGGLPRPSVTAFSRPLCLEILRYGVPMMLGWELSGIILSLGDRYIIQGLLGSRALGQYAAAYNLCQYVEAILLTPWAVAIMPIYVRLWEDEGAVATSRFLERSLRYYILLGIPIAAGLSAVGPDLLAFLASDRFREGAHVIPAVIAGLVLGGAIPIVGAGVFIQKRTWLVARLVSMCALVNLALNGFLVPALGIQGAAIATLASYAALLAFMGRAGSSLLTIHLPWGVACRAAAAGLAMLAAVTFLHVGGVFGTVALRIGVGAIVYGAFISLIDRTARESLAAAVTWIRSALG